MFIYLLIAAELAVLYTVFWYLYLREPKASRRIRGSMWGTYEELFDGRSPDPTLPLINNCSCTFGRHQHAAAQAYARQSEFVLDQVRNQYVPAKETGSLLVRMADSIDRTFSHLNVRP